MILRVKNRYYINNKRLRVLQHISNLYPDKGKYTAKITYKRGELILILLF